MDCLVRLFYGGSVGKEDGVFMHMEEELEMFNEPPSFSNLLLRVEEKFVGDFTLKGRFDSGKTRAHYVLMPLRNEGHWLRYTRVIQESNVTLAEVVVENGYRKEDVEGGPSFDQDKRHPLNSGICAKSPVNQKRKKTCQKRKRSLNTDTPSAESIPELSDEIVLNILVRLPVKSLLRCKSVCKGWRAIITDSFFVHAHLQRSASRCEQDPCLIITPHIKRRHIVSKHIRFYQWQQGASMATLMNEKDFGGEFTYIYSFAQCDGLVLVLTDARFYLFNPATKETITLPDRDSNWQHDSSFWASCCCAGLGLDPRTGKHKVARAFYRSIDPDTGKGTDMGMEVLTISGNNNGGDSAWREIKDDLPYPAQNRTTGTAVNGFLFWRRDLQQHPWGLLRLSLADETFGITNLPDPVGLLRLPHIFALDVLHGELCVSARVCKDTVTMWMLLIQEDGGQGQTWEQRYTVQLTCVYRPLAFLPDGQMMLYTYRDFKVCLYDMATAKLTTVCQINRMKYQGRRPLTWKNILDFDVHLYTESLIRISV